MILVVCLDQRNGMRFNNRRQSFDRCVIDRIIQMSRGKRLYLSLVSDALFSGAEHIVCDGIPVCADCGDIFFFETGELSKFLDMAEMLIVFRWDKVYPADTKFPMDSVKNTFSLQTTELFQGYSHDVITQEVYVR